jgi:PIN domain nuclease of toxin-antitoxin system
MRLLLDTHTLIWTMNGSPKLSQKGRNAIEDFANEALVSIASVWEAAIKFRSGKLPEAALLIADPQNVLSRLQIAPLPIALNHARLAGSLISPHKDPFDRMLAAQALLEGLTLVGADPIFDSLLVPRLW